MVSFRRVLRSTLGLLCAVSAALQAACASVPQGSGWLQVKTAHFDLHTDLRQPEALDMARALEESRAGLMTLAWGNAPDPPGRTQVAVFASEERFHEYVPEEQIDGLALSQTGYERLMVLHWTDARPAGLPRVAVHEIAHDLSLWFTPLQPAWYCEGMATFLEGLEFDRATRRAILGGIPEPMERNLRSYGRKPSSADAVFTALSAFHEDRKKTSRFYFTSWLLVHYLINRHEVPFKQFQLDLSRLRDWHDAWSSRFPELDAEQLDAGLEQYLDGGRFEYSTKKVELVAFSPEVRKLSSAEGYGISSWIAHRLGARELSAQELEAAVSLDPNELNALRARYDALQGPSRGGDRLALARQLVHAHPESGEAWLLLARSSEDPERALALDRARSSIPEHPGVLELLASGALAAGDFAAALAQTQILIRRTSLAPTIVDLHLRALAGNRRCEAAERFVKSSSVIHSKCTWMRRGEKLTCAAHFDELIRDACPKAAPPAPASALRTIRPSPP